MSLRPPSLLARQHTLLQQLEPILQTVGGPQIDFAVPTQHQRDGTVRLLVLPFDAIHVDQFDLEEKLAHLRDPISTGSSPKTMQIVPGQDEIAFLPSAEEFVALLP